MTRRFQFSLARLFVTIAFVTLVGSHVYTSWKLKQAREDVDRMATELGRLTITDPNRLNVLALKTYDDMTWRWRVHVPTGREYGLFSATREIPRGGSPPANAEIQTMLEPGEYILTVAARPDGFGKWRLTIAQPETALRTSIAESDAAWLADRADYAAAQAGTHATQAADDDNPFILLQLNCERNLMAAAAPPAPGETTEGIMIWAAEQRQNAPGLGPRASGGAATSSEAPSEADEPSAYPPEVGAAPRADDSPREADAPRLAPQPSE